MGKLLTVIVVLVGAIALLTGCKKEEAATNASGKKDLVIGMVAKSQSNDVFQAAYAGAKAAAGELSTKHGVKITINWQTPASEDSAKQVEAIEALVRIPVDAILVSCTDAATLAPAIDRAVAKGVPVMTFDSDAPTSKRFAYYGSDNAMVGQKIAAELAKQMNNQGTVAVLAGNPSSTNLSARVTAVKAEIAKHSQMKLLDASGGVFYHEETPEKAAEAVATATNANPSIQGWAFIGGWPLFTTGALKWEAGKIKVVSCDALPPQLDYVRDGRVQVLYAQDCFGWGHKSVETIVAKLLDKQEPANVIMVDPLTEVTKANVDAYAENWKKWLGK